VNARARPFDGTPWPLRVAAFCISILAPGCAHEPAQAGPASVAAERLSFVPAARVTLSSDLEVGNDKPLLVAQFEVTRGEWRGWYLARGERGDADARARVQSWDPATSTWPATDLSLEEAREFAAAQGLRLLSSSEWLRTACGSSAAPYPWGRNDAASVANTLELGLRQPTPVGTFEQGRSPLQVYDLVGNVWEWVERPDESRALLAWALGGSYLSLRQPLFDPRAGIGGTQHLELDATGRSNEVGLRLCAEAGPWLEAHAAELSALPEAERRLAALGRRWGPAALPLLEELALAHPGERAFGWLRAGARP
jgi:Sulfatase-modifying factor enzyme 1